MNDLNTVSTMGSKRGRLLMRQHRIKKESDSSSMSTEINEMYDKCYPSLLLNVNPKIERTSSEPGPNTLTVPSASSYLVKQNSSPHLSVSSTNLIAPLTTPSQPSSPSTVVIPAVHIQAPSPEEIPLIRSKGQDIRRSLSTPLCGLGIIGETCESRSCHCPVLRPGPALGCNFCWNTIDDHGRILRRKTKYHCPECQTNLCIVPCFQEYHERQSSSNLTKDNTLPPSQPPSSSHNSGSEFPTIIKTSSL